MQSKIETIMMMLRWLQLSLCDELGTYWLLVVRLNMTLLLPDSQGRSNSIWLQIANLSGIWW